MLQWFVTGDDVESFSRLSNGINNDTQQSTVRELFNLLTIEATVMSCIELDL